MWARQVLINVTKTQKSTMVSETEVDHCDGNPSVAT